MAEPGGAQGSTGQAASTAQAASDAQNALVAAVSTAETEARRAEIAQADPSVLTAFALGWQMAEVYRPERRGAASVPASDEDLPGMSRLTMAERADIGLEQVQAGVTKLKRPMVLVGVPVPDARNFAARIRGAPDPAQRQGLVRKFHVEVLAALTAADFRLGKAYGLGRALADTTRGPVNMQAELAFYRVRTLTTWMRELSTALPEHAAHAVASSLEAWASYVANRAVDEKDDGAKLGAQGRLWRSLLSGEKRATDTLETSDYARAAERMLKRMARLGARFVYQSSWLAMIVVLLFVGGVVVIAVSGGGAGGIGAGAAGVLASLGLSWKAIGSSLGRAAAHLEQPLWDAELDRVIYERITPDRILSAAWGTLDSGPDEPSLARRP